MQQFQTGKNQSEQRLDKFLHKYLPNASNGFLFKMLRKKNITLNGKKAEGNEILKEGDIISFYFSDETFEKFSGHKADNRTNECSMNLMSADSQVPTYEYEKAYQTFNKENITILYEDSDVLILNKPAGILSQKAEAGDLSMNEWMIGYLLQTGKISPQELSLFKPSVCNRLDRNTSGLILCGISLKGSQTLSELIRKREIKKFYRTICLGKLTGKVILKGDLIKDTKTNTVKVSDKGDSIQTAYEPLEILSPNATYLEVELITGKTHQIRAHLSSIGHPLLGDHKYGNKRFNNYAAENYQLKHQLLHAYRIEFPVLSGCLASLSGKQIIAPLPEYFEKILEDMS